MSIGQLRKRVIFQRRKRVDDGGGGGAVTWVPAWSCWGALSPERGRERVEAGRLESASTAILKVRSTVASRAIDGEHRAMIDDVPYQVRSIVNPDQRNRFLEILVEVGVAT